jgi:uncharacterized protein (TIGR00251 family)
VPEGGDFRTEELPVWIERRKGSVLLALHVQPGARRTAVVGPHGNRLKVAVASPPAEGRANAALIAFLADRLDLPRSSISVVSGASSREKRLCLDTDRAAAAIAAALESDRQ